MSIFQAVLLQIDERHEVDWDAVKQVDVVTIGDDGDEYDCDVNINDCGDDEISTKVQSLAKSHIFDQIS